MTVLGSLLERRAIRSNDLWGAWASGEDGIGGETASGATVTRNTALGLSAVWACVRIIADTIATLAVDTYTVGDDGVKKPYRPRPTWLDVPNSEQTLVDFIFGVVASLLLDGNAFIYTIRNRIGDVIEAWVIDPEWVQVRREYLPNGQLGIVYYIMVAKGQQSPIGPLRVVAGPDMFHITAFNPNSNWPRALSTIEIARQMLGAGIANQEMGARFYGHGMNASGVIENAGDMTIEQARELKRDFGRANGGFRKMHLPPVLTGGATWKQISINPEQAQFLESRQAVVQDVARWFGVPLWMLQANDKTTSWGTGVEQQGIAFVTYTLRSWITRVEQGWQRGMLMPFHPGVVFDFNVKELLRGDHASRAAWYTAGRFGGWFSANDVLIQEGLSPIGPEGDVYLAPLNSQIPQNMDPGGTTLPTTTADPNAGDDEEDDDAGSGGTGSKSKKK